MPNNLPGGVLREKDIRHVGISFLRNVDREFLSEFLGDQVLLIHVNRQQDAPLAALLSYEHFMRIQEALTKSEGVTQ